MSELGLSSADSSKKVWYIERTNVPEYKCSGCRICELVCSMYHERLINPQSSRIRVVSSEPAIDVPHVCRHCGTNSKPAPCMEKCPQSAISRQKNGLVSIDHGKCNGCSEYPVLQCKVACPFDAIFIDPKHNCAMKCDCCEGDPQCVKYCPAGVLYFGTSAEAAEAAKQKKVPAPLNSLKGMIH